MKTTALTEAAQLGHLLKLQSLLENEHDINRPDGDGFTPLMAAVLSQNLECIGLLLEKGANRDVMTEMGTACSVAAGFDDVFALMELTMGLDETRVRELLTPAIHTAAFADAERALAFILSRGVSPNLQDGLGDTPLMMTAYTNATRAARLLLASGAVVNFADEHGRTALMRAAAGNQVAVLSVLIAAGASIDAREKLEESTALHQAAQTNAEFAITKLLAAGADPNKRNKKGESFFELLDRDDSSERSYEQAATNGRITNH